MHRLEPARLKPGVSVDQVAAPDVTSRRAAAAARPLVRGRALIFWDPKAPPGTRKRDAIDTDQITPAADCVSESLETLDERWRRIVPLPDAGSACIAARRSSSPATGLRLIVAR
jgi:hypothetical protein